jgi:hypothetical protein
MEGLMYRWKAIVILIYHAIFSGHFALVIPGLQKALAGIPVQKGLIDQVELIKKLI